MSQSPCPASWIICGCPVALRERNPTFTKTWWVPRAAVVRRQKMKAGSSWGPSPEMLPFFLSIKTKVLPMPWRTLQSGPPFPSVFTSYPSTLPDLLQPPISVFLFIPQGFCTNRSFCLFHQKSAWLPPLTLSSLLRKAYADSLFKAGHLPALSSAFTLLYHSPQHLPSVV